MAELFTAAAETNLNGKNHDEAIKVQILLLWSCHPKDDHDSSCLSVLHCKLYIAQEGLVCNSSTSLLHLCELFFRSFCYYRSWHMSHRSQQSSLLKRSMLMVYLRISAPLYLVTIYVSCLKKLLRPMIQKYFSLLLDVVFFSLG